MLTTGEEVQGEGGIQQHPLQLDPSCPVKVLQPADLLEARLLQLNLKMEPISAVGSLRAATAGLVGPLPPLD